jgi:adenylylsulfate kinase
MIFIQLTGLSGAGKTTLSFKVKYELEKRGYKTEVIDGDDYRQTLCKDLGFSKTDRIENIRRLGFVGKILSRNGVIVILSAINPYEEIRLELKENSPQEIKTVWIDCDLETLQKRDTKGLYKRALLSDDHPDKLHNLTGVSDPFETPQNADLIIKTADETADESTASLLNFILENIERRPDDKKPKALFIGRWQPFHNGHKWLIEQKLQQNIPVLIAVRDVAPDEKNPLTTAQTVEILGKFYDGENVGIITIPNIESVNFGRNVGYEINEFTPPDEIGNISATEIRKFLSEKSETWKEKVDEKIHDLILKHIG